MEGPESRPIAVLAGSANLTVAGLNANVETMVEAVQHDKEAAFRHVLWLERQAWDATGRILAKTRPKVVAKTRPKSKESVGSGCLSALVSAAFAVVRSVFFKRSHFSC
ncbi:MAG: hypothetical protein OXE93_05335 [bacterium]|nr:hypothetical protein [bacterium]